MINPDAKISSIGMSIRLKNCLTNLGIATVRGLVSSTRDRLMRTRNFGRKAFDELETIMTTEGLTFGMVFESDKQIQEGHLSPEPDVRLRDRLAIEAMKICPINAFEHEKASLWCYERADAMLKAGMAI
jgi:hypothetical protein